MSTRFFLTDDSTAPAVSPTISATDWLHINTVRRKLLLTADSSTLASTAYTPDAGDDLVIGNAHHRQYISDPLGAQTILSSSTVQAQFQTLEAHINNNLSLTLKVYTVDSGGTFKSALLAVIGKGTEPTAALRNTSFAATALNGSGGNVTVANGDRLVVEIGLGGTPTATSGTQGHNGTIRWGCTASSGDLPVDETQAATTYRPWVEFSANLVWLKTASPAADALGSYADELDHSKDFNFSDNLGGYADVLDGGRYRIGWSDAGSASTVSGPAPIAVNLPADGLAAYADAAPVKYTFAASIADSLGLYGDQAPSIAESLSAAPAADSLGLYSDQPPTVFRQGILTAQPAADSLVAYADTANGFFTAAAAQTDALNLWADQGNISTGAGAITVAPPADALGSYADPAPTIRQGISITPAADPLAAYGDNTNGFFTIAARPSDDLNGWADQRNVTSGGLLSLALSEALNNWADVSTNRLGQFVLPSGDPLPTPADQLAWIIGKSAAPGADAMAQGDQLAGAFKYLAQGSDPLGSYADQLTVGGSAKSASFTDSLANWTDQVTRAGMPRAGWADSITVNIQMAGSRSVNFTDTTLSIYADGVSHRIGLSVGAVIYLVDGLGNYIVDENGNRVIISGLIDNMQQGDAVAVTRTTLALTPRSVAITDALPIPSDAVQVSRGIVTLDAPLSDALPIHSDALIFVELVGVLIGSFSDALGGYNDSTPGISTSGEQRVAISDPLANYADSAQFRQVGILAISLTDTLGVYSDAAALNTSGGLQASLTDALGSYSDQIQRAQIAALTVSLTEPIGGSYSDALGLTLGIRKSASDSFAVYGDNAGQLRGLLYATPADGLRNYLDFVTTAGVGQLQVAISDNLGQYNDIAPAAMAHLRAQPQADDLNTGADSLIFLFGLNHELNDALFQPFIRPLDFLDARVGLFNELRYGLSDDLNQWTDAAAYVSTFFALRLTGKVQDQISLTGKVIAEQITLNGKAVDKTDLTGGLYIGEE